MNNLNRLLKDAAPLLGADRLRPGHSFKCRLDTAERKIRLTKVLSHQTNRHFSMDLEEAETLYKFFSVLFAEEGPVDGAS